MAKQTLMRLVGFLLVGWCSVALAIGPPSSDQLDEELGEEKKYPDVTTTTRLNVIIPVFDPNVPEDPDEYAKEGIWPELRRTESKIFAVRLRDTIEATGLFGAVRVTPNDYAIGELYVVGKIEESTSEVVRLRMNVQDISERHWFGPKGRVFEYRVREYDFDGPRNAGQDHYQPVYDQIADAIAGKLARKRESDLLALRDISTLVLARSYSAQTFEPYFRSSKSSRYTRLSGLPADDDPQYLRIKNIRAREELFVDELQDHYGEFVGKTSNSYVVWQKESFPEAKAYREARQKARRQLLTGLAVAGLAVAVDNQSDDTGGTNDEIKEGAAIAGAAAAAVLVYNSFKTRKESRIYFEQLSEAGRAVDVDLSPTNVEFEGRTVQLTGNAARQFQEIRSFLRKVYDEEATPQRQL